MNFARFVCFCAILSLPQVIFAEDIVNVIGQDCEHGVYKQPEGPFAVYVFCDDALATNIAVYLDRLGAPLSGSYKLGKRFWQNEEWVHDVTSFAWLKNNHLLLATSQIYGTGAIYKLDLSKQKYEIVRPSDNDGCVLQLHSVQKDLVKLEINDCENLKGGIIEFSL